MLMVQERRKTPLSVQNWHFGSWTSCRTENHLGSTAAVINDKGELIEATMYTAYGEQIPLMVLPGTEAAAREKFTGKEFDTEGGSGNGVDGINLDYFGARYLDPEVGVWLSVDPADQFWNGYSYCGGDPVNLIDPFGLYTAAVTHVMTELVIKAVPLAVATIVPIMTPTIMALTSTVATIGTQVAVSSATSITFNLGNTNLSLMDRYGEALGNVGSEIIDPLVPDNPFAVESAEDIYRKFLIEPLRDYTLDQAGLRIGLPLRIGTVAGLILSPSPMDPVGGQIYNDLFARGQHAVSQLQTSQKGMGQVTNKIFEMYQTPNNPANALDKSKLLRSQDSIKNFANEQYRVLENARFKINTMGR